MWTITFVTLFLIGIVVFLGEAYERKQYQTLRQEIKKSYLKDFYELLRWYDENPTMSQHEEVAFKFLLEKAAKRVSVFYPGFTAPTLE